MFNIVLFNPQIPPNTGNIIRLCSNTNSKIHLIKPLGFSINKKSMRRAGLDYIKNVEIKMYKDIDDFLIKTDFKTTHLVTKFGNNDEVIQTDTGFITQGTMSFFGCNYTNRSGTQIEYEGGFYLPNVDAELNTDNVYWPCQSAPFNTSAAVCPSFWISPSNYIHHDIGCYYLYQADDK